LLCSPTLLSKENFKKDNTVDNKGWNNKDKDANKVNTEDKATEEEVLELINKIAY
jgi:hypothetical protein